MRIAIAIASTGRAPLLRQMAPLWRAQTRPADRIVVAGASPADVEGLAAPDIEVLIAKKGLPAQRNAALDALRDADLVVFFDDDFVPAPDFLAKAEAAFAAHTEIAVGTGRVLADGINTHGLTLEEAQAIVAADHTAVDALSPTKHAYGCNMMLRMSLAPDLRFDERLPLYAWQEDRDFSRRLAAHGAIMRIEACAGVHMGVKAGRQSGVRFGYSQIANPLYLVGKGTMTLGEACALAGKNVLANAAKSLRPEPWVDRAGRLKGNALALGDALIGRMKPERILEL